ncbi:MAG: hypothetical protein M3214_10410 [Actinomycetota bacterium]|nr:hypothetical protein [Actinomycetota bacterium]
MAREGADSAATDAARPPDDDVDITQSSEVTPPIPDAPGIESSDTAVESGTTTDDAVDDASSDGATETTDNSESPTADPDATPDASPTTPSQDPGSGTVDLPTGEGDVDQDSGAVVTSPGELPDSDVADVGGGEDSGSTDDGSIAERDSGSGTQESSDGSEASSSGDSPQPDIEQIPDNDSSGEDLPVPPDKDDDTDKENSEDVEKADDEETDVEESTTSVDDDASDGTEEPDADVIEDYVATGTEIASNDNEKANSSANSSKDRNNEPSPRAVRSDLNTYGSAYTGVKSGRSSSPWRGTDEAEEPSLAHLVEGGNRIEGTASFELVAEERKGETKQSAQVFSKGLSLPFSNGFGMPLTGFDILVMSLMGLSLILVGVVLFARGLERQSAARRSTRTREALEAPSPASGESAPLSTRIRGLKRKRVV